MNAGCPSPPWRPAETVVRATASLVISDAAAEIRWPALLPHHTALPVPCRWPGVLMRSRASCCDAMAADEPASVRALRHAEASLLRLRQGSSIARVTVSADAPSQARGTASANRSGLRRPVERDDSPPPAGGRRAQRPASTGHGVPGRDFPSPAHTSAAAASGIRDHEPLAALRSKSLHAAANAAQPAGWAAIQAPKPVSVTRCRGKASVVSAGSAASGSGVTRAILSDARAGPQRHFCRYNDRLK